MTSNEEKLLKEAYLHYTETGNAEYCFAIKNEKDLSLLETLKYLGSKGYVTALSENIYSDSFQLVHDNTVGEDLTISFKITYLGSQYIKEHLET